MNIIIIGPQASGKGTQASKLSEKFGLAHVEMGSILRSISQQDNSLGEKVKNLINKGMLVPDEIMLEVLNDHLRSIGKVDGLIFDGFPRVLSQAEYFESFLAEKGKKIDLVIYLTLSYEETLKRLAGRRICKKCGKVYNLLTNPPKVGKVCDDCGGELVVREDETPQAINKRLEIFENQTKPVIEFYEEKGILEAVSASWPIEVIFENIIERLEKRGLIGSE